MLFCESIWELTLKVRQPFINSRNRTIQWTRWLLYSHHNWCHFYKFLFWLLITKIIRPQNHFKANISAFKQYLNSDCSAIDEIMNMNDVEQAATYLHESLISIYDIFFPFKATLSQYMKRLYISPTNHYWMQ